MGLGSTREGSIVQILRDKSAGHGARRDLPVWAWPGV